MANALASKLVAAPVESGNPLAPPAILNVAGAQAALALWRELAPALEQSYSYDGRFNRQTFALFCVWTAMYFEAYEDVLRFGKTVLTPMTNGGEMLRINPAVRIMETAHNKMMELVDHFGLTPMTRMKLLAALPEYLERLRRLDPSIDAPPLDNHGEATESAPGLPLEQDPAAAFAAIKPTERLQ